MKTSYNFTLLILSVIVPFASNCKEKTEPTKPQDKDDVEVSILVSAPSDMSWEEDDAIRINGVRSSMVELDEKNPSHAKFTFNADIQTPYSTMAPASVFSSKTEISVPGVQDYSTDGISADADILLGYGTSEGTVELAKAMSYLKITVKPGSGGAANIKEVVISNSAKQQMSGIFKVQFSTAVLGATTTGNTTMTLRCGTEGVPLNTPMSVAIPARKYSNLIFRATDVNGNYCIYKITDPVHCEAGNWNEIEFSFDKVITSKLSLTPFLEMNAGESIVNSHSQSYTRTRFVQMQPEITYAGGDNVTEKSPGYPRIYRLSDGKYLMTYQKGSPKRTDNNGMDTYYAISDNLSSWEFMGALFEHKNVVVKYLADQGYAGSAAKSDRFYTNAEVLQLSNGDLLAAASYWVQACYNKEEAKQDHGIAIKRSKDNGRTWSDEKEIFHAQAWEPFLIERPDGQIQCYFSEARSWISSSHSGTSLIYSTDGGDTWTPGLGVDPLRVMRRLWWREDKSRWQYTDQMPVGIVLNGTDKMAFAVEDVGGPTLGDKYTVSIIHSGDNGEWPNLAESMRWDNSDAEQTDAEFRQDDLGKDATGPYLIQFKSGETVLSYPYCKSSWPYKIRIGDPQAKNFGPETTLFTTGGNWGSTRQDTDHAMLVLQPFGGNIHIRRYALNHDISGTYRAVTVDGDNSEWSKNDEALFFSDDTFLENATVRCSYDSENIYFLVESIDHSVATDDVFSIFISEGNDNGNLTTGARRITVNCKGLVGFDTYDGGNWLSADAAGVVVSSLNDGSIDDDSDSDNGWLSEIAVPLSELGIINNRFTLNATYGKDYPSDNGFYCHIKASGSQNLGNNSRSVE